MVRALAAHGHDVELLTYPAGRGGRARRASPPAQPAPCPSDACGAGPSLAKLVLDVPVHGPRLVAHGGRALRRRARGRGGGAPRRARSRGCSGCRWWSTWTRRSPTSCANPASRARGPLLWAAEALERHALRHAAAVITVCTSLTEGVRAGARPGRRLPGRGSAARSPPPLPPADGRGARGVALGLDARPVVLYSGQLRALPGRGAAGGRGGPRSGGPVPVHGRRAGPDRADARARRARARRCVFAGKRRARRAARAFSAWPRWWSRRGVCGANTPFKVYTYLASGRPARRHAHPQPHPAARRLPRLAGRADAGRAGRAASAPVLADPARRAAAPRAGSPSSSASTARRATPRRWRPPTRRSPPPFDERRRARNPRGGILRADARPRHHRPARDYRPEAPRHRTARNTASRPLRKNPAARRPHRTASSRTRTAQSGLRPPPREADHPPGAGRRPPPPPFSITLDHTSRAAGCRAARRRGTPSVRDGAGRTPRAVPPPSLPPILPPRPA